MCEASQPSGRISKEIYFSTPLVIRVGFSSCKSDGHAGRRQNLTTTLFGGRAMTVKTNIKAGMNKTELVKP